MLGSNETAQSFGSNEKLAHDLVELCINPEVDIQLNQDGDYAAGEQRIAELVSKFQRAYGADACRDFVLTTVAQEIFETLDHALAIQKMVVIEGDSGCGKTTAAEAWCAQHQGEARFVSLSGITQKTGFFQKLASAVGVAASQRKAIEMQRRVEEFFRRTRLMLVIDEAHYLFPEHHQRSRTPELVNWVNTALVNQRVPVALICTDQFAQRKARTEQCTGWTSEQLEHRVKRYNKLSSLPTKGDLSAVATQLLRARYSEREKAWTTLGPVPSRDFVDMVVGYALTAKLRLPAVADTIEEARHQARRGEREQICAKDIQKALLEYRIPSDGALRQAFQQRPMGATIASFTLG